MDLATILKAIAILGDVTPAAMDLYRGFIASTNGATQAELQRQYEAAMARSDELHGAMQERFSG